MSHNSSNNYDLEMYILGINESTARIALETGINESLITPVTFTDKRMYLRYKSEVQKLARFDKVAYNNNQYYGFNYITGSDANESIDDMGTTFYAWQNWSLTEAQVVNQVSSLISSTKK